MTPCNYGNLDTIILHSLERKFLWKDVTGFGNNEDEDTPALEFPHVCVVTHVSRDEAGIVTLLLVPLYEKTISQVVNAVHKGKVDRDQFTVTMKRDTVMYFVK